MVSTTHTHKKHFITPQTKKQQQPCPRLVWPVGQWIGLREKWNRTPLYISNWKINGTSIPSGKLSLHSLRTGKKHRKLGKPTINQLFSTGFAVVFPHFPRPGLIKNPQSNSPVQPHVGCQSPRPRGSSPQPLVSVWTVTISADVRNRHMIHWWTKCIRYSMHSCLDTYRHIIYTVYIVYYIVISMVIYIYMRIYICICIYAYVYNIYIFIYICQHHRCSRFHGTSLFNLLFGTSEVAHDL